ncbi:MAG: sigma-70 family RNA polymerase sigma factor [Bacteroidia bacterium]|nr:sigma-70 family RNA polymerase sigma factor [Bacteroidia bacterium]
MTTPHNSFRYLATSAAAASTSTSPDEPRFVPLTVDQDALLERELLPHADLLFRFAYKLTGDEELAADLVQETYFKACRYIGNFQAGSNAKAWLYRILKNNFINEYRRKKRTPAQIDIEKAISAETRPEPTLIQHSSQDTWIQNLMSDEVARAIRELPVDYRVVVVLCDIEEFSYEEIAEIVDIPVGTVRSRLHRGRNILRDRLTKYALTMGYGGPNARYPVRPELN